MSSSHWSGAIYSIVSTKNTNNKTIVEKVAENTKTDDLRTDFKENQITVSFLVHKYVTSSFLA